MLVLIQRVSQAAVHVDDEAVGQIGPGLLALVGMEPGDTEAQLQRMAERLLDLPSPALRSFGGLVLLAGLSLLWWARH